MIQHIKTYIIRALGGFPGVQDAIDEIQTMELQERKTLLTLAVRRLYNTIGPDDILSEDESGEWVLEGKQIGRGKRDLLISEAKIIEGTLLWKVMQQDVKYQANRKMFLLSKTDEDLTAGKLWLYTLDVFSTRLSSIASGKGNFNSKG